MTYKIFPDWCKIKLFYGVAIILSIMLINGNLYASTDLTADEEHLIKTARELLAEKAWADYDIGFALQRVSEAHYVPSQTLKTTLTALHDAQENTLAHYFVKNKNGRNLYRLLRITGFAILDKTNTALKKPFSDVSLEDLNFLVNQMTTLDRGSYSLPKLGAYLAPLLRVKVVPLIEEFKRSWGERYHEGIKTDPYLSEAIKFSPMVLAGQKLEDFSQYFSNLLETPEGRNLLRTYRLEDGSTLLSYYGKQLAGLDDYQFGEDAARATNSRHFHSIKEAYVLDDVMVTWRDLDILETKDLVFCLKNMPGFRGVENNSKQFWLQYRNSKGRNLLQLIFDADDDIDDRMDFKIEIEEKLHELRRKIGDDTAF